MSIFEAAFNKASIYDMFFLNIKSVLEYPTLNDLKNKNDKLYYQWKNISQYKDYLNNTINNEELYQKNAVHYPEFSKIVAITYAMIHQKNGEIKRQLKKISHENEFDNIHIFMDVLHQISSNGMKSTPKYFPIICGHDIISNDIPLLIKRFLIHRKNFEINNQLPFILKRVLNSKPWESENIIDISNLWKFNGLNNVSLMLIAEYMGLKKNIDILNNIELSKYYWDNINNNPTKTTEFVALQSANQTNVAIQLINELRQL